jgi:hypothetical protein
MFIVAPTGITNLLIDLGILLCSSMHLNVTGNVALLKTNKKIFKIFNQGV